MWLDTGIWRDERFLALSEEHKLLAVYLCVHPSCDAVEASRFSGVKESDIEGLRHDLVTIAELYVSDEGE